MKNIALFFIGFFCITAFIFAQNVELKIYFEDHYVGGLASDGDNIWVGVDNTLVKMEKSTGATIASYTIPMSNTYPDPNSHVSSISLDGNGMAWITCQGITPYLEIFSGGENWTEIPVPGLFTGIVVDKDDKIWVTAHNDLYEFDGTELIGYDWSNTGMTLSAFSSIAVDDQNNKWLGLTSGFIYPGRAMPPMYLVKFDGVQFTMLTTDCLNQVEGMIYSIDISTEGIVWMGTIGNGLISFDGTNWEVYNSSNSGLPHDLLWNVTVEGANIIWMSTESGLTRFDGITWETFNTNNSMLRSNAINSILVDDNGTKWVGTDKGLISFTGNNLDVSNYQYSQLQFNLFPNPANDFITLKMPLEFTNSTVEIYNTLGKSMKSFEALEKTINIDVSTFANGLYFIRLQTANGVVIKKFVKQN
ncbi:T9SS type A sorting domain-containing protein [Aestuariivivens sp. NBU2969]|uniref:T9SS type A sorting domain-containing protein n=1 Tax=Aestuariivivens sp. NBU2969 TaxID=2873267 RepID=UPI001CBDEE87|nr:T9SS type A sorting domain-containing protein [Aestuariivivens sp. NBU2969]